MPRSKEEPEGFVLPKVDLRPFTRDSKKIDTRIFLKGHDYESKQFLWIHVGAVEIRRSPEQGEVEQYILRAHRLVGYTDFEHDSAKALTIPMIGVKLATGFSGCVRLIGWIDFNPERANDLRIFNPNALDKEASTCKDCEKPHPIVQYVPSPDPVLFNKIRGMQVEIFIGATSDPEPA